LTFRYDHRMRPAEHGELGAVLSLEELAADKLLALFGRAEARDFVDVYLLSARLGIDRMLGLAKEKDAGFDQYVLATTIDAIERHRREEFDVRDEEYERLRTFYRDLRAQLIERALPSED
jgi:nucleotidyltransferase AbiEii toxin of type IV toxin-antitoxin system